MNFVEGEIERADSALAVKIGAHHLAVDERERALAGGLEAYAGRKLIVGVRPEHLEDAALAPETPADRRLRGLVRLRESLGSETVVHFQIDAAPAVSPELIELTEEVDESALLGALDDQRRIRRTALVGRFGVASGVREDEDADVAVLPAAMRFFDAESGRRIGADASA
jgi:multiple sugar transport system ATP-binding protein